MQVRNILFFFFLLPLCCFSQAGKKVPLKKVLDQIAETHHVKFSYIEEELAVYALIAPAASLPLAQKLEYIEQHTRLRFESIANGYYTIYNDHKMDKPLCGYLVDQETGKGIENAQVHITGTATSATSNAEGYFELPIVGPNTIAVRHMGYKEKSISPQELYATDCAILKMEAVVEPLEEVVTQRYLATGIIKNEVGQLVIKPEKFGILPGLTVPDVLQTMQQIPGITSVDETVSNISVRGGTHDQNLFLWNGIRMFQTGHFFGLISAFNALPTTNITISKNGSSAFFGESVSSTVDMSTMDGKAGKFNAASLDMISINILSKIKLSDKASVQISTGRTFSDVLVLPTFRNYQQRIFQNTIVTDVAQNQTIEVDGSERFYFYDFSVQYSQKVGTRHKLVIDAIEIVNSAVVFQETPSAQTSSDLQQSNFGGSFKWKTNWNNRHASELQGYLSGYEMDANNESIQENQVMDQQNNVSDKGFRLRHAYIASEQLELDAGYQFDEITVENSDRINVPAFSRTSREVSRSHAAIAESSYRSKNGGTQLKAGVRGNYFEKFSLVLVEPRLSFSQALTDRIKLEVLGERKSQTLSQIINLQQDFLGIEKRRWTLANEDDIPIQKSSQVSLGFTYRHRGWLVTVDNFYKKVAGITSSQQGFQNQFEFADAVGDCRVLGSEMLVQKSFTRFYGWISYSFNRNDYRFESFTPSDFPSNFSVSHAVTCAGIYEWHKLHLALGAKWHTGKPITTPAAFIVDADNPANSQIVYNNPNNTNLDDYFQVNCSVSKSWDLSKTARLTASASLLNVLDKSNVLNRYYRINANTLESVNTYSLGRTPNICVKVLF